MPYKYHSILFFFAIFPNFETILKEIQGAANLYIIINFEQEDKLSKNFKKLIAIENRSENILKIG